MPVKENEKKKKPLILFEILRGLCRYAPINVFPSKRGGEITPGN